jgi:hypothetical protein
MTRVALVVAVTSCLVTASAPHTSAQLPLQPPRESGQSITPAFEGWFKNDDGTFTLLVGYFNRNQKETLEIPVGPNNRIEPGGPDMGQPTQFLPRRQWGVLTIKVPADFGTKRLTWTIVAHNQPMSIPLGLTKGYQVEPYKDAAEGNTPPVVKFAADGQEFQGPPLAVAATFEATVGKPLELTVWAKDDAHVDGEEANRIRPPDAPPPPPPVSVTWTKHRGDGEVTFAEAKPKVDPPKDGKATTTATFSRAGEYTLRLQANDSSGEGGGGFQCCWTNAYVKVNVKPGAGTQ